LSRPSNYQNKNLAKFFPLYGILKPKFGECGCSVCYHSVSLTCKHKLTHQQFRRVASICADELIQDNIKQESVGTSASLFQVMRFIQKKLDEKPSRQEIESLQGERKNLQGKK